METALSTDLSPYLTFVYEENDQHTRVSDLLHAICSLAYRSSSLTLVFTPLYRYIHPHTYTTILSLSLYVDIHIHVNRHVLLLVLPLSLTSYVFLCVYL